MFDMNYCFSFKMSYLCASGDRNRVKRTPVHETPNRIFRTRLNKSIPLLNIILNENINKV